MLPSSYFYLHRYDNKQWLVDMIDALAPLVNDGSPSPLEFTPTGTWFIADPIADSLEQALVLGDVR